MSVLTVGPALRDGNRVAAGSGHAATQGRFTTYARGPGKFHGSSAGHATRPDAPMSAKDPKAIAKAGVEKGAEKARLSWDKALVAGFLAGAYIAFGCLLAITASAGMDP